MLSNVRELVKNHQSDIFLTVSIVLIALISFGAGRLTSSSNNQAQIIIQNPPTPTASVEQSVRAGESDQEPQEKGIFIGSANSDKYHWPDCQWAKRISGENQVWFSSEKEAQSAGYIRCGNFEKYIPDNYQAE